MIKIPIPSWSVGAVGLLWIIVSTAVVSWLIHNNDVKIGSKETLVAKMEEKIQLTWDGHKLAGERFASADILAGLVAQGTNNGVSGFLVPSVSPFY